MLLAMAAKKTDSPKSDDDKRICGMVSVAVPSDRVTRPVFGKHGFAGGALVMDWPAIVGSAVAAYTLPLRITFPKGERGEGTLVVKVANSAFATQLQHLEPLVLQRINGYFGYGAVARLKLVHGPLPRRKEPPKPEAEPDPETLRRFEERLAQVEDEGLREVLARLGRHLAVKP